MVTKPICRYCNDRGCLCCSGERLRRQKEVELPQPIFVAKKDSEGDMALLRQFFGAKELERLAEQADGDMTTFSQLIRRNAATAALLQAKRESELEGVENGLKNAPGIFERSKVTQEPPYQAKSGVTQNFADD